MQVLIKLLKLLVAVGFLVIAYLFLMKKEVLGLKREIFMFALSVLGAAVLFVDFKLRGKAKRKSERRK